MIEISLIPIDNLTFENVQSFCSQKKREHRRLDYKSDFSSRDPGKQISKEVAAFANTEGGVILYGVDELKDRVPNPAPDGSQLGEDARMRVVSACAHNIFPPVAVEVSEFLRNPKDDSLGFLVIRVPASDQVHSIDGGTGIYIRFMDQSEPVRANIEQIKHLLAKVSAAESLQERRRSKAAQQLRDITPGCGPPFGRFSISIGPKVSAEPLFKLTQLRDRASELSVHSYYFRQSSPLGRKQLGVLHGLYSRTPDIAGLLDVFGNITLYSCLAKYDSIDERLSEAGWRKNQDGLFLCLDVTLVIERLIAAFRAARRIYEEAGFVGLLSGSICFDSVRNIPFVRSTGSPFGGLVVGTCWADNDLEIEILCYTTDLASEESTLAALRPYVQQMLWAWDCTEDREVDLLIAEGGIRHHGEAR